MSPIVLIIGIAKLEDVTRLMNLLSADLDDINLLPHREYTLDGVLLKLISIERDAHLEQLKVYGRDPTNADPIFTNEASYTSFTYLHY
jgi:hypothetical protein